MVDGHYPRSSSMIHSAVCFAALVCDHIARAQITDLHVFDDGCRRRATSVAFRVSKLKKANSDKKIDSA